MSKPSDYKATALWHKSSGSLPHYVRSMQQKCVQTGAPLDALYQHITGTWVTMRDLQPDHWFHLAFKARGQKAKTRFTKAELASFEALRAKGCAVCVFLPSELGDMTTDEAESIMCSAVSDQLPDNVPPCDWSIRNTKDSTLFWSNDWGWVEYESCDLFNDEEHATLSLPLEGAWGKMTQKELP